MALAFQQASIDLSANVSVLFVSSVVVNKILSFFLSYLLNLLIYLFTYLQSAAPPRYYRVPRYFSRFCVPWRKVVETAQR